MTIARGHPYERDAFHALVADLEEYDISHVEQPLAQRCLGPETAKDFDALLCYDMPGVDFTAADSPELVTPDPAFQQSYLGMLDAGIGMVCLHHAIAAWPAWPDYADIIGGRFHYRSAELRGKQYPDSGYRHGVTHRISKLCEHPVTQGIPDTFEMTDELYLFPVLEENITPLLQSSYQFVDSNFYSAAHAVAGTMNSCEGWSHPPGSNLVGWVTSRGNSPIVYLQGGDDGSAMSNEHFKRLVHNAVRWVSSEDARGWAKEASTKRR